jgi:lysozyme
MLEDVKKMIREHEGTRFKPYKDLLGLWTVGVGHLIGDGKTLPSEMNRTFSEAEVQQMFDKDFNESAAEASKIPGYGKMNETGKAALIDLTFNMGKSWYKDWPKLMTSFENKDYNKAADNLEGSKWYKQVKGRGKTIVSMIRNAGSNNIKKVIDV